ncbi:MAG: DNA mismatch repair protein MutS [Bacilli bacterium]|nr:DNA mismatch repair protein MutS [Bacilli bacterium]
MTRNEVDRSKISPMMNQYMDIKDKYNDVIVFFRLGDFYEMFFEDAVLGSHELELTLTGKNAGIEEKIPMCGVPYHAANTYLNKLVDKGYKVAICEQVEDPKDAKGVVKREVVQVVSKGTIMSEDSLDEKNNNYIASIIDFSHCYVISYADISTGLFNSILVEHSKNLLVNEILFIGIKEIVVNSDFDKTVLDIFNNKYGVNYFIYDNIIQLEQYKHLYLNIDDKRFIDSINHLLSYLDDTQKRDLSHLRNVNIIESNSYLKMDINTKRNLELVENLKLKSRNYSLLWLLDKTKTAMGSRMLKNWIESPLIDITSINNRYNIVENLLEEFILKEELRALLYEIYDLERLCGRISFGNLNARDLLQLKNSIKVLPNINSILKELNFYDNVVVLDDLYKLLDESIEENPPITIKEGSIIKTGYNAELDELRSLKKGGKDFISKFEMDERNRTNIKNLKVGYNRVFGYYIEISKGNVKDIPDDIGYERKQTLSTCERYTTPLLKEKEELILNAEDKIVDLEYNLFNDIRDKVKEYISVIQKNSNIVSEIDVLQSFATVSEENGYIKPELIEDRVVEIKDSRHPIVEKVISEEFVPNDINMNKDTNILLITGPNMAGKSTYLKQFAITVIMSQIGCFVPASSAKMPVFNKIFTRIGASDDLVSGESTFMVEMNEANNAIINADENSLIIFDELGRGTATYDGMSIAQSIVEYIHNNVKCKMMFSTHYHELTDLEKHLKHLKNIHVSAIEEDGNITFLHKIKDGFIDKSYGVHVAKLANLPDSLINRAYEILSTYECKEKPKVIKQQELNIFDKKEKDNGVLNKIKELDILKINPIEALNILYDIKKDIDKKE